MSTECGITYNNLDYSQIVGNVASQIKITGDDVTFNYGGLDVSFSGNHQLACAVQSFIENLREGGPMTDQDRKNIAALAQEVVATGSADTAYLVIQDASDDGVVNNSNAPMHGPDLSAVGR